MKKFFQIFLLVTVFTALAGFTSTPDRAYVSVVKDQVAAVSQISNLSLASATRPLATSTAKAPEKKKEEVPAYGKLTIPSISVKADVVTVGVTSKGAMANPGGFKNVGWYKYGAVPGKTGSAVLAGHVDNALALPGVFKNLHKLEVGDDIYFEKNGKKLHFKVKAIETYPYNDAPLERIFNDKSGKYMNLITCTGTWNKLLKEYEERLVVYTELVEE